MNNFNDIRKETEEEDVALFYTIEMVGKLIAKRDREKLSNEVLANMSGVSQDTIFRIEEGLDTPDFETLCKLAKALKMNITLTEEKLVK